MSLFGIHFMSLADSMHDLQQSHKESAQHMHSACRSFQPAVRVRRAVLSDSGISALSHLPVSQSFFEGCYGLLSLQLLGSLQSRSRFQACGLALLRFGFMVFGLGFRVYKARV